MTLGNRIKQKRTELDKSQQWLADKSGVSQGIIANLERRNSRTSTHTADIAKALNVSVEWLMTGNEPNQNIESNVGEVSKYRLWSSNDPLPSDGYVDIPFFKDVEFQGGAGTFVTEDYNDYKLPFAKSTLYSNGVQPDKAVCITLTGDSMEPVMPAGTTCGINTADTRIIDGKHYALDHGGLLRIKRLYRLPNGYVRINSYNSIDHPDETVKVEDLTIIGRVFNWSVMD